MHNVFSRVNRGNGKIMQRRDFLKGLAAAISLVAIRKNSTGVVRCLDTRAVSEHTIEFVV